jgi:catalase
MKGEDPDHAQRDLVEAIDKGDFPKWNMKIQVMPEKDAKTFHINPFDLTKVWPHGDYPLIDVGVMELNHVPENYFADVEQAAFAPAHVVNGISYSPDKMLQGRILSYPDAHRYRLGANYEQLPVNRCPFAVNNFQRDGLMRLDGNGGSAPNYFPNSFDNIVADEKYKGTPLELDSSTGGWYDRNAEGENDHYSQPGNFFRKVLSDKGKKDVIHNIAASMSLIEGPKKDLIINRQLCHLFRADIGLGIGVANALGVNIDSSGMPEHKVSQMA